MKLSLAGIGAGMDVIQCRSTSLEDPERVLEVKELYSALIWAIRSRCSTSSSEIVLAAYSGMWMYLLLDDGTRDIGPVSMVKGETMGACIGVAEWGCCSCRLAILVRRSSSSAP